jgi:hypothetical protein
MQKRQTATKTLTGLTIMMTLLSQTPRVLGESDIFNENYSFSAHADYSTRYIQRTMGKLSRGEPVRILFYGHSITRCGWVPMVEESLHKRFPKSDIQVFNLAIGGFAAQRLIYTTERDLKEVYPDMVVFHVYGSHVEYEKIIRLMRSLTTAEIALQRDHYGAGAVLDKVETKGWHVFMNDRFIPAVARTYNCTLFDVRSHWLKYLLDHGLQSKDLLRDGVHLNADGNRLMADLIDRCMTVAPVDEVKSEQWIKTLHVGQDVKWGNGVLRVPFEGNRVVAYLDAEQAGGGTKGVASVLIDGKKPSTYPGTWIFSRPNSGENVDWPWDVSAPYLIESQAALVNEDWTIPVTSGDKDSFAFKVEGSITGSDGEGSSQADFVSKSGRIVIAKDRWWTQTAHENPSKIAPGYAWRFNSRSQSCNTLDGTTHEQVLASGLPNATHILEIKAADPSHLPSLKQLVIHCPPLKGEMPFVYDNVKPEEGNMRQLDDWLQPMPE